MPNSWFQFKEFRIDQARSGLKVTTDGCLFGAYVADHLSELQPKRILDIGTGTGLLALMLAQFSGCLIDAIDINKFCFKEASANVSDSPWKDRISVFHTSLQSFKPTGAYDLIICNPPFFKKNLKGASSHKNQALHSDDLQMEELAVQIKRLISRDGSAFVMYPAWEMSVFEKWMEKTDLFVAKKLEVRNKAGAPIFRVVSQFKSTKAESVLEEMEIKDAEGAYTLDFRELLRPYYLDL